MPVPQEFIESVAGANIKTIAEAPSVLTNQMLANAVAFGNAQNQLLHSISAKAAELLLTTDISEAGGLATVLQQASKIAGNTPPVTP